MLQIINTSQRGENEVTADTVSALLKPHERLKCNFLRSYMLKFLPYTFPTWIELNPMVNTYPTLSINFYLFFTVSVYLPQKMAFGTWQDRTAGWIIGTLGLGRWSLANHTPGFSSYQWRSAFTGNHQSANCCNRGNEGYRQNLWSSR